MGCVVGVVVVIVVVVVVAVAVGIAQAQGLACRRTKIRANGLALSGRHHFFHEGGGLKHELQQRILVCARLHLFSEAARAQAARVARPHRRIAAREQAAVVEPGASHAFGRDDVSGLFGDQQRPLQVLQRLPRVFAFHEHARLQQDGVDGDVGAIGLCRTGHDPLQQDQRGIGLLQFDLAAREGRRQLQQRAAADDVAATDEDLAIVKGRAQQRPRFARFFLLQQCRAEDAAGFDADAVVDAVETSDRVVGEAFGVGDSTRAQGDIGEGDVGGGVVEQTSGDGLSPGPCFFEAALHDV